MLRIFLPYLRSIDNNNCPNYVIIISMIIGDKPKICPSCLVLTPPEKQVKRVSRSSGKQTVQMRCFACEEKARLRRQAK